MTMQQTTVQPGQRVRVTQQIAKGDSSIASVTEGEVVRVGQQKTGSWYAHSRDKKLWLDRLELRLDDGELVVCNLDQFAVVEVVGEG